MDAKDIRNIQEAYMEVYQELDEAKFEQDKSPLEKEDIRNKRRFNTSKNRDNKTEWRRGVNTLQRGLKKPTPESDRRKSIVFEPYDDPIHVKSKLSKMRRKTAKNNIVSFREDYDIYDIILSHLLDEGYAETVESAQAIMVNMSEEWRDEIVEEMLDEANKAEKMLGLTPRQREQARNLHQYTGKPIFYGTNPNRRKKPDRSDPILNKSHKDMTAKRQASHKAGRHLRGDTGESGNVVRSRYQANKDHKDGYPSIKRVDT